MEGFSEELVSALKEVVSHSNWQCVGDKKRFTSPCTKLYSVDGEHIVLIHAKDKFYAMDSACPHEGGPMEQGDIEELCDGRLALACPWHYFEFCLDDGSSPSGLQENGTPESLILIVADGRSCLLGSIQVYVPARDSRIQHSAISRRSIDLYGAQQTVPTAAGANQVYEVKVCEGKVYIQTPNALSLTPWKKTLSKQPADIGGAGSTQIIDNECSLTYWASKILCTPDPEEKAKLTHQAQELWNSGTITEIGHTDPPVQPSRKEDLTIVQPGRIKRGKGGTLASRIALLHSLANIEQWAIDLSWDIVARFAAFQLQTGESLPKEFFSDFIKVAGDEAKHYCLLEKRLVELGSHFGDLPVHNGLWQSASDTAHDLLGRLAIVHMVHEARGLDVHPQTLQRFSAQGDESSAQILDVIYTDEITHVAAGLKWFTYICNMEQQDCLSTFHELVPLYFRGYLKPPFNTEGRKSAGMSEEWYLPLVKPS